MVVPLRPAKFYGSSLPRPQFYTDVKFNDQRVDPPPSVLDPLLDWAKDAHWSMGGLNFKRTRQQGKIEGNIKKLRAEGEKRERKSFKVEKLRAKEERKKKKSALMEKLRIEEEEEEERAEEVVRGKKSGKIESLKKGKGKKSGKIETLEKGKAKKSGKIETLKRKSVEVVENEKGKKMKKNKTGEVEKEKVKKSDKNESESALAVVPSDDGIRRSRRRKLVLRDEGDEEMEF